MATILLKYFGEFYPYTVLLRFFNVIELGFISWFIYLNIKNATAKRIIIIIQPLFICYCIYDFLSSKQPSVGYYPAAIECIIMIIFIIYFFFELMQEIIQLPLYVIMEFWLATALLIYFSGNFFLFVYSKTMINEEGFMVTYKYIYSTIIILKNIFICLSILYLKTTLANVNQNNKSLSEESIPFFQD
ncbi:hypothetical protein [Ferruginibacter sp. SUN106]|uniref:hypothetical protein n=1 Tax=Ferruginibacter sp. SUN106 TaxID=2978348 RepID=UPI003D367FA7